MDRRHLFKHKSATAKSIREKRRHERQELRKKKRDAALSGKRVRQNTVETEEDDFNENQVTEITQTFLASSDGRLEVLKSLRRALSLGSALIESFLNVSGSLQRLVEMLDNGSDEEKIEAAWCLNNISAGTDDHARMVIDAACDSLIRGLSSGNVPLEDHCSWAIGNLAGGSVECRDLLRKQGVIKPLINLLLSPIPQVVRCAAFALSNLARDKETTGLLTDAGIVPHLSSLLVFDDDKREILSEVLWVLTYLTACGVHEKKILEAGVLEKIIDLVINMSDKDIDDVQVWTPLLRCFGNIICSGLEETGSEMCTRRELFPILNKLLQSEQQHVRKECIWLLSNITALPNACKELIDTDLLSSIVNLLSSTYDVKKEAAYTLCNVAANVVELCGCLLEKGALTAIIPLLKSSDVDTIHYALTLTELMLQNCTEAVQVFESAGGLEGLEGLEYNSNDMLREQADSILDVFFYKEDKQEREVDALGPADDERNCPVDN